MGFTYPGKFTYLNTFVMQVAQRCSDNQGSTVLQKQNDTTKTTKKNRQISEKVTAQGQTKHNWHMV